VSILRQNSLVDCWVIVLPPPYYVPARILVMCADKPIGSTPKDYKNRLSSVAINASGSTATFAQLDLLAERSPKFCEQ